MKTKLFLILTFVFAVLISAKEKKEIKVSGNCGMCKKKIEKSLKINEVYNAKWDQKKKVLTVAFNEKAITLDSIQQRVAAAGYDTEKFKATDENYASLPECCLYRDVKEH
ncbi:MAG: cation transporter [Bacteroidetes bacterium]|nr:cation transporter [Bacteroidota bacterium]